MVSIHAHISKKGSCSTVVNTRSSKNLCIICGMDVAMRAKVYFGFRRDCKQVDSKSLQTSGIDAMETCDLGKTQPRFSARFWVGNQVQG